MLEFCAFRARTFLLLIPAMPLMIAAFALTAPTAMATDATAGAAAFKNCTAMHGTYPHGVGRVGARDHTSGTPVTTFKRSNRLYRLNSFSDADHDGIACEKR